jgi:hypothetical protein
MEAEKKLLPNFWEARHVSTLDTAVCPEIVISDAVFVCTIQKVGRCAKELELMS